MKFLLYFIGLFAVFSMPAVPASANNDVIQVASASSMRTALGKIIHLYSTKSDTTVRSSFASSGTLMRQIIQGAPFDLFLSADEKFVTDLTTKGLTRDDGKIYARGRLVLMVTKHSGIRAEPDLDGLLGYYDQNPKARFSIANPGHAPYGRAAQDVLQAMGLANALKDRLVVGENISQSAQFIISRSAPAGLVSLSMALTGVAQTATNHAVIPDQMHPPINHRMVILSRANTHTEKFFEFLNSEPARTILRETGFDTAGL